MHIGLMPDIKEQPIARGIEDALYGDRQLHNAEIRSKMTACLRNIEHKKLADLFAKLHELLRIQRAEIFS